MLKKLTLKNFRKHTNASFDFSEGLHVVGGANEGGKSTMLEGAAYAMLGVKALRSPLSETVTWDEPEGSLKATLEILIDEVDYTITRSKSSAEITYAGGIVTGQTEVTNFITSKLKVDANSASKLMLSTQMDIRGALEAGPKATTELIEKLAEFDQIDHLIEIMQEKLALGSSTPALAQLEAAQSALAQASLVEQPDFNALEKTIKARTTNMQAAQREVTLQQDTHTQAVAASAVARAASLEYRQASSQFAEAEQKLTASTTTLAQLQASEPEAAEDADTRIQEMLAAKANIQKAQEAASVYAAVKPSLGKQNINYYGGSETELRTLAKGYQETLDTRNKALRTMSVEFARVSGQMLRDSCTFCGKDFSEVPEVKARNQGLQKELDVLTAQMAEADREIAEIDARLEQVSDFTTAAMPFNKLAHRFSAYLRVGADTVPPVLEWRSEIEVAEVGDQPDYDGMIRSLKAQVKARTDWEQASATAKDRHVWLTSQVKSARSRLSLLKSVDETAAASAREEAFKALTQAQATLDEYRAALSTAQAALRDAQRLWDGAKATSEAAARTVETAKAAVRDLEFNNALLKKVRAARPVIADKLWNLVLASVSTYFSEMRGTRSIVSKESGGFMVDGHSIAGLSGSTLDILGLAIRVALVRTFLPEAQFLVLDEPCASMDQARTESLLGFLVSVGFNQIILVTHEDVSKSVADHIITLGD
jgi:DNA repair exonuclease SbcCD ATPase subunit